MHTTSPPITHRVTRRQLTTFALVLPALVLPTVAFAVAQGVDLDRLDDAPAGALIALYGQAFMPAVAALIAWAVGDKGLRGFPWGFRRTPWRNIAVAWVLPVLGTGLAYGTAWVTGAARFDPGSTSLPPLMSVLLGLIPGVVPYMVLAIGEQLGWSSLLVTRLSETRGAPVIVGLAWAAFHFPLMLFVPGAVRAGVPTPYALLWFTVEAVALAFPLVGLRIRTGSIWPVLVLHATLNASIYLAAEPLTAATAHSAWWLGEGGALTSGAMVVAVLATRRWWRDPRGVTR